MTLQQNGPISLGQIATEYGGETPHALSEYSTHLDKTPGQRLSFGDFHGTSAQVIVLPEKTFQVYTTKTATIPASNILAGAVDEFSGGNDPVQLVSVQSPVNGSVSKDGSNIRFTSNGSVGQPASFEYTARNSIGKTKTQRVTMQVVAIPPIICNPDTFDLQQGETALISRSKLTANDTDGAGRPLTVTQVGSATGGTVSLNNDTITFVSTGIAGEPAGFEYTVINDQNTTQTGRVYINVTPLPEQELYIYRDTATTNTARASQTPPTVQDVFDSWGRFDGNQFYSGLSEASGNAAAWQFLTGPDRVQMPLNVYPPNGFVAPDDEKVDNYTFEATLNSNDSDDDTIGLVAAFTREKNAQGADVNNILTIVINTGGTPPHSTGCGVYLNYDSIGSTNRLLKQYNIGTGGGWSGKKVRVKIQRQQDIFKFYVSNWNDIDNYNIASEMIIDLNSDPELHRFKGKRSYGYITYSQPYSTYLDIKFSGGLNKSMLCDIEANKVWRFENGQWRDKGETIQQVIGYTRKVSNPETGHRYIIKQSSITYLGKATNASSFNSSRMLSGQQNLVLTAARNQSGAGSAVQVVALYEKDREERNHLQGKSTLMTSSTHTLSGKTNKVGNFNWFANNGINLDISNFIDGTVVFADGTAGRITAIGNTDGSSAFIRYDVYGYTLYDLTL
ncbi:Ig-like domain-containing protein [Endozoicomonadaceae bacterium StTr2]